MKKNLDLNRLGMVIRWDVLNNWTYNLGSHCRTRHLFFNCKHHPALQN